MQCQCSVTDNSSRFYSTYRCSKEAKYEVVGQKQNWKGEPVSDPQTFHVCGTHKRTSDKNGRIDIWVKGEGAWGRNTIDVVHTQKSAEFAYRERLTRAEERKQWELRDAANVSKLNHSAILHAAMRLLPLIEPRTEQEISDVEFLQKMRDQYDAAWQKYLECCDDYDAIVREGENASGA
jgi:hypothetical protein